MTTNPHPSFIAQIDQACETSKELARLNHSIYTAHTKKGFTPDQALEITLTYLAQIINPH